MSPRCGISFPRDEALVVSLGGRVTNGLAASFIVPSQRALALAGSWFGALVISYSLSSPPFEGDPAASRYPGLQHEWQLGCIARILEVKNSAVVYDEGLMTALHEFRCEICGIVTSTPIHWFVIQCGNSQLTVLKWNSEAANSAGARHFCGEGHAQVYISRWFDSACSPPKPDFTRSSSGL